MFSIPFSHDQISLLDLYFLIRTSLGNSTLGTYILGKSREISGNLGKSTLGTYI